MLGFGLAKQVGALIRPLLQQGNTTLPRHRLIMPPHHHTMNSSPQDGVDILDAAFSMSTDHGSTEPNGRVASMASVASVASLAVPDTGAAVPAAVATPVARASSASADLSGYVGETLLDEKPGAGAGASSTILASGELGMELGME